MAPKLRAGWVVGRTPDIGKYYEFGHQIGEAGTTGYALSVCIYASYS